MARHGGFNRRSTPPSRIEWGKIVKRSPVAQLNWTHPQQQVRDRFHAGRDIVIYSGGNFGGKTYFAVAMAIRCALGLESWCPTPADIFLVGLGQTQARGAFQRYLKDLIPPDCIEQQTSREGLAHVTTLWNGSIISVGTVGQGAEMHQGARRSLIVYDEEPDYEVFEEGLFRIREGMQMRILITATPTRGRSWVWSELVQKAEERNVARVTAAIFENGTGECPRCQMSRHEWDTVLTRLGLSRDLENQRQKANEWMHLQINASLQAQPASQASGHCGRCWTFGVNPRVEAKWVYNTLKRVSDTKRTAMRFLGSYEELDGENVFTRGQVKALEAKCREPERRDGPSSIYCPPIPGHHYATGVDCARGTGRDETVICTVDASTGEQVAVYGDNESPFTEYGWDVIEAAVTYNNAMLVPELASAGEGLIPMLAQQPGLRIYTTVSKDKRHFKIVGERLGFISTQRTRNTILMQMIQAINDSMEMGDDGRWEVIPGRENVLYLYDSKTVDQLAHLFYNEDEGGKIMVNKPQHDDRITGLALAWEGRNHPSVSKRKIDHQARASASLYGKYLNQQANTHRGRSYFPY